MKFYVPEIGDQIRLTADWNFKLYNERRNRKLWDLAKSDKNPELEAWNARCEALRAEIRRLEALQKSKMVQERNHRYGKFWSSVHEPEFLNVERKYWEDPADEKLHEETRDKLWEESRNPHVSFVLPAGSLLSIDRIYIRKGVKEFSSLTFYLKETTWKPLAKKKKGATRFWAKLQDVNNVEFEHVPR